MRVVTLVAAGALLAVQLWPVLVTNLAARELSKAVMNEVGRAQYLKHAEAMSAAGLRERSSLSAVTLHARILLFGGSTTATIEHLARHHAWPPRDPFLQRELAVGCAQLGDWPCVKAVTATFNDCRDRVADALVGIGSAAERRGQPEPATKAYEAAIGACRGQESGVRARLRLASLLQRLDRQAEAIELYRSALRAAPRSAPLAAELAQSLVSVNDLDGALAASEHAVAADPTYAGGYAVRATVRLFRGDAVGSIMDMETVATQGPLSESNRWILASAYARAGRTSDALAHLRGIVQQNPQFSEAQALLRSLERHKQ